jgi:hypothetical protein
MALARNKKLAMEKTTKPIVGHSLEKLSDSFKKVVNPI